MKEQQLVKVTVPSKWGDIAIFCSDLGIAKLLLPKSKEDVEKYFTRYFGAHKIIDGTSALATFAAEEITQYLAGNLKKFDSPCDLRLTPFAQRVLHELQQIPYGTTISYADLAEHCGNPRAFRAVGWAMANNPIPIVIPCHRVINANGKLGNYSGGIAMKKALLALETKASGK